MLQYRITRREYVDLVELGGQRLRSLRVYKCRLQSVSRCYCPFNNYVAFGDKNTCEISIWTFSTLTQGFVAKPLEHIDTGVIGVLNRYQHTVILIEQDANGKIHARQLRSRRGVYLTTNVQITERSFRL